MSIEESKPRKITKEDKEKLVAIWGFVLIYPLLFFVSPWFSLLLMAWSILFGAVGRPKGWIPGFK